MPTLHRLPPLGARLPLGMGDLPLDPALAPVSVVKALRPLHALHLLRSQQQQQPQQSPADHNAPP
jgi:hypothetical protein